MHNNMNSNGNACLGEGNHDREIKIFIGVLKKMHFDNNFADAF